MLFSGYRLATVSLSVHDPKDGCSPPVEATVCEALVGSEGVLYTERDDDHLTVITAHSLKGLLKRVLRHHVENDLEGPYGALTRALFWNAASLSKKEPGLVFDEREISAFEARVLRELEKTRDAQLEQLRRDAAATTPSA